MAEARIYKLGNVYTRVKGLIRGGVLKWEDRPLWYDVYEAFPPKFNPVVDRPPVMKEVEDIMYPEDIIRAQFYKTFVSPGVINLSSPVGHSISQKFVNMYLELTKDTSIPRERLFQATVDRLAAQGTVFSDRADRRPPFAFRRREAPLGAPPAQEVPEDPVLEEDRIPPPGASNLAYSSSHGGKR